MRMAELPEDTQLVYANWVRMVATAYDLSMDFGYNHEQGPPERFPIRVAMSWEHAKALADLLQTNIAAYEAEIGTIRGFL